MRSDEALRLRLPPWLRSQGLGLVCAFSTVVLLAIGSFVLVATAEGASADVRMDELRGFFTPPSFAHLWLYLLVPVLGLYALNTLLATWDNVSRRWRAGTRAPSAYAAAIVHAGFLLALLAHAVGGFLGRERGAVVLASGWQEVPGFGEARLVSLDLESLPGGMPREAWATLELRDAPGRRSRERVGYNAPLSRGAGATLAILSDVGRTWVAHLESGDDACAAAEGQSCRFGGDVVSLVGFAPGPSGAASAIVVARAPGGAEARLALARGDEIPLAGGRALRLAAVVPEEAVVLRAREAPGNPWALAASLLMAGGVALMWRKLVR